MRILEKLVYNTFKFCIILMYYIAVACYKIASWIITGIILVIFIILGKKKNENNKKEK